MIKIPFGNLKRQYKLLEDEIKETLQAVLSSGQYVLGEWVGEFEKRFGHLHGGRYAVGVASGTDALNLALRAYDIGQNDEVITQANTCVPTICAINLAGARPVFCDVDSDTCMILASHIEELITERTKAILVVNLYGYPADLSAINDIAKRHDLVVIEDCAQSVLSTREGALSGTTGDIAAFSFYPSKNLGGFGDGGMVLTSEKTKHEKLKKLRQYGQTNRYVHELRGINSRLDEIQAALLCVKLNYLPSWNKRRREISSFYSECISNTELQPQKIEDNVDSNFHLFVLRSRSRERVMASLENAGIQTLIHYPVPVHRQPAYRVDFQDVVLPNTELLAERVVSIPNYPELSDSEVEYIGGALKASSKTSRWQ
jgi:dTDP-4-amino-4,6-dideoxygalactose transaminase